MIPATPAIGQEPAGTALVNLWRAPLVPVALAATAGIVLDRYGSVPLPFSLIVVLACLAAWVSTRWGRSPELAIAYLLGAVAALGAAYHHWYGEGYAPDDIRQLAQEEPRPARLRGVLIEEPVILYQGAADPLRSMPRAEPTLAILQATAYQTEDAWLPVSGRVRLIVEGRLADVHASDELELVGRLALPHQGADNPGEPDPSALLRDQRIGAVFWVRKSTDAVTRLRDSWPRSLTGWLGVVRGWGQRQLAEALPPEQSGLAMALLLGEGAPVSAAEWDKYKRTGVVHLLVVSGQQLVVLAAFLGWTLWLMGLRRRQAALAITLFLLAYALLTGGRPPQMRSAVTICTATLGLILGRTALPANSFALAWLVVAALNPTDMFTAGCQLSFLTVAMLYWGAGRWFTPREDDLDRLVNESRPLVVRLLRWVGRQIVTAYLVTLILWLVVAPLVASHYHMVSPIGVLLGPPMTFLMSIALIAGFLLLLSAAVLPFLVPLFAWVTSWSLAGCDSLVTLCDGWPGAYFYVGDLPSWWLWLFYPGLLATLTLQTLRPRWRWALAAGVGWFCVGLLGGSTRPSSTEFRCTFLAVGHGGCTVLETSDGRTLIYDAGAMTGPELTARHVAPYLWSRGVRRIDEVFLSHADLDHFNGLPALLERFAVGQVSCTPTFTSRDSAAVKLTMATLERSQVPLRIVQAGDRLRAGEVELEVLHPPATGPAGRENFRSLVLLIRHAGHRILLTGDLEGPGLDQVLAHPLQPLDVLMAPHHGSKTANTVNLADWARARVVVSCEGLPRGPQRAQEPYSQRGSIFLGTWPHGAITVRSSEAGLWVETFRTGQRFQVHER